MALLLGLLRDWLYMAFSMDIGTLTNAGCQIRFTLLYWILNCSSWVISCVSMERLFSVYLPHRVKNIFSFRNSAIMLSSISACLFFVNSHFLFTYHLNDDKQCRISGIPIKVFTQWFSTFIEYICHHIVLMGLLRRIRQVSL